MKKITVYKILLLLIISQQVTFSQSKYLISLKNADCKNAILINDSIYGPTNPPLGYGSILEINNNKQYNKYFFTKEHNTVWYIYKSNSNNPITFDIIPINKNDHYDFLIFEYTDSSTCKLIKEKNILPLRTNISRVNKALNGYTGISDTSNNIYTPAGIGTAYSKYITPHKEQKYLIAIDNVYKNGSGHTIIIKQKNELKIPPKDTVLNKKNNKDINSNTPINKDYYSFSIACFDKETKEKINCSILIANINHKDTIKFKADTNILDVETNKKRVYINCKKTGYIYNSEIVNTKDINNIIYRIELNKIVKGTKIIIDDIYFYGNMSRFLPTSTPALKQLYDFLKENLDVKIEVQGHVNGNINASQLDKLSYQSLSNDRAKAVENYLIENGIDKKRITSKGLSDKFMLYPIPKSEIESQKNRRVEIIVVE